MYMYIYIYAKSIDSIVENFKQQLGRATTFHQKDQLNLRYHIHKSGGF